MLDNPAGAQVDSDSSSWTISGDAVEYGYLNLTTNTTGSPGYYSYSLSLYDDQARFEDSYSGSIYLCPLGYCIVADYDEYFYDVIASTPWTDTVCLDMDVDTTGGYVTVTVYGELYNPGGSFVDTWSDTWTIYGTDLEYGSLCLTAYWGGAGWYDYYLELYDDLGYYEDSWYGSVYLTP